MRSPSHHVEVVSWRHTDGEPSVGLKIIMGELARTNDGTVPTALVAPGFGENGDTAEAAITQLEGNGIPAAVWQPQYHGLLPVTKANNLKVAEEATLVVARHVGGGKPVDLVTHSLGDLVVLAAHHEPGAFRAVASDSPHACSELGWLASMRPAVMAKRLVVDTFWQLRQHRKDPRLLRVVDGAKAELSGFGKAAWPTAAHAFSDKITRRIVDGYVVLSAGGHAVLAVAGADDRVSSPLEIRGKLGRAAEAAELDPGYFDDKIHIVEGVPHMPWFLPGGAQKLGVICGWLIEQSQPH